MKEVKKRPRRTPSGGVQPEAYSRRRTAGGVQPEAYPHSVGNELFAFYRAIEVKEVKKRPRRTRPSTAQHGPAWHHEVPDRAGMSFLRFNLIFNLIFNLRDCQFPVKPRSEHAEVTKKSDQSDRIIHHHTLLGMSFSRSIDL